MKYTAFIGLLALSNIAFAADKVLLEVPITYTADASANPRVREECRVEDGLAKYVGKALGKLNRGEGTLASATEAGDANILKLQISHILGVGGGAYSGPKAVTVYASLTDKNGKVLRSTRVNRWSIGGFWGGFKGTCSIIDRCAVAIGKDMARWVRDPSYVVKDEGPPKEGAMPTEPEAEDSPSPATPS